MKHKCKLLPFKNKTCISVLESSQKYGWQISAFDLPKAWEHTGGENVKIAVLDTGCDLDHDDLKENLLEGKNFINKNKPPYDDCGHGCQVTGILVAKNNDIGMVGVCPNAKVLPLKVLDKNGIGNLETISEAIRWAVEAEVDLITMSLGSPIKLQQIRKAIQYAASKGIVTFCAAGNAGNGKEIFYPANYPETIAIGAIDKDFNIAKFSNTGRNLDFMAPGVDIFSTAPGNWYSILSGTSMSCPFAVGVAALFLSYLKKTKPDYELRTADHYRNIFKKHTVPVKNSSSFFSGFGIIDPVKFFESNN